MVVLVILGLLAGLVGPRLFGKVDQSKVQTAQTQIKMLRGALQAYRLDVGRYPNSAEGLAALMRAPAEVAAFWSGPYLEDELPPTRGARRTGTSLRSTTCRASPSGRSVRTRPRAARASMPTSGICRGSSCSRLPALGRSRDRQDRI